HAASVSTMSIALAPKPRAGTLMTRRKASSACPSSGIAASRNVPEDLPFDALQDVYWDAYRSGCKGCTTYRPNAVTGAVLEAKPAGATPVPAPTAQSPADVLVRSEKLTGATYKLRWPDSEHAFYVTINDVE